ncbi:U11/U12 small nuclear ribonucleoprotein 35 kDa protein-like [Culicoides brevitarsis]|uniref:U11/U12 small nuclear ribonucleoprotein 35 kDa protein-like n=1 Tax=Culicoides brevitarsis TaxID=469753 RepID=UPI00307C718C
MSDSRRSKGDSHFERYLKREYCPIRAGNIDGSKETIHDVAVVRALNATYKPEKRLKSIASHTIFVRISPKTSEETLKRHFSKEARIISCKIVRDIVTGMSKGYGFIELKDKETAEKVVSKMNKAYIDDFRIIVQKEAGRNMKNWKPRRLGGGFGGNRNSGQLRFGGIARPFEEPRKAFERGEEKYSKKR